MSASVVPPAGASEVVHERAGSPVVLVTSAGAAEGSRGAAAALACAGADADLAPLLVELGGRLPRPTLLASAAAQALEQRLVAHLPSAQVAARGQVCHLAATAEVDGYALAAAASTVARPAPVVLHVAAADFHPTLDSDLGARATGILLRAELPADRPLLSLAVRDLLDRDLAVAVLKRRLPWVAERRAHFGMLPADVSGGLPPSVLRLLQTKDCYTGNDGSAGEEARRDRADARS